jgi:hypothetical protein
MTVILILAHGATAPRVVLGTGLGLPLAMLALLAAIVGRWQRLGLVVSMSWGLAWFALMWSIAWCTFVLYCEGLPDWELWDAVGHSLHTELNEYIVFFGPSALLGTCAVVISGRERKRLKALDSRPPKCAKCGYLLVGLEVPQCPECGTPFDPALLSCKGESAQR